MNRQCTVCDSMFQPVNSTQTVCSEECRSIWVKWKRMWVYHISIGEPDIPISCRCGRGRVKYFRKECPHCKAKMEVVDDSVHKCPSCGEYMCGPVPGEDISPKTVVRFDDLVLGVEEFKRFFKIRSKYVKEDDRKYRRSLHGKSI